MAKQLMTPDQLERTRRSIAAINRRDHDAAARAGAERPAEERG